MRDGHILEQLRMTAARFWQYVRALLGRPEALPTHPMEVRRLHRLRDPRRSIRRAAA